MCPDPCPFKGLPWKSFSFWENHDIEKPESSFHSNLKTGNRCPSTQFSGAIVFGIDSIMCLFQKELQSFSPPLYILHFTFYPKSLKDRRLPLLDFSKSKSSLKCDDQQKNIEYNVEKCVESQLQPETIHKLFHSIEAGTATSRTFDF